MYRKKAGWGARFLSAFMSAALIWTALPVYPAQAAPGPEALPIYVGWGEFSSTGEDANVANDGSRVLNFPRTDRTNSGAVVDNRLRVVPARGNSAGIVVRTNKIKLQGGFSTYFVMALHGSTSTQPADGMTFIIQDNPDPVIGAVGYGVGYEGIPNSIGVEFDIWQNIEDQRIQNGNTVRYRDLNANHVAIVKNGKNSHSTGDGDVIDSLDGSFQLYGPSQQQVHVWVDYDADGLVTTSYLVTNGNQNPSRTNARTIERNVSPFLTDKDVYVGFGASTGGSNAHHDILAWYFKETYVEGGLLPDGNYRQGASAVTVAKTPGANTVDIKVKGRSTSENLPNEEVDIYINNNSTPLSGGPYVTDAGGNLVVPIASGDLTQGSNTIRVVSRSGGTSGSTTIVQTAAPQPSDIVGNATDGIVEVSNVAPGAEVVVYDGQGNELVRMKNTPSASPVVIEIPDEYKDRIVGGQPIQVAKGNDGQFLSQPTSVNAKVRSQAPSVEAIFANATRDRVIVQDVPSGAIVKVYSEAGTLLETGTQGSQQGILEIPWRSDRGDLLDNTKMQVTIQLVGDLESTPTPVESRLETSDLPVDPVINVERQTVDVKAVPAGARVIIYDPVTGEELASETNFGDRTGNLSVDMSAYSITENSNLLISVLEVNKYESGKVPVAGRESTAPQAGDVSASATRDTVTVKDVEPGTTIRVYDKNGRLLGEGKSNPGSTGNVVVSIPSPGLDDSQRVDVTAQQQGRPESQPVEVIAQSETSAPPVLLTADANANTVSAGKVPAGAKVTVYRDGVEIGTNTRDDELAGTVNVTIPEEYSLTEGEQLTVTITEPGKLESSPRPVIVRSNLDLPVLLPGHVDINIYVGDITVEDVPPGFEIIIYDEDGRELDKKTNDGGDGPQPVTFRDINLPPGRDILISVKDPELDRESVPIIIRPPFQPSGTPSSEDINTDPRTGTVTVGKVPPGTTVTVKDEDGNVMGTATNNGDTEETVVVTINPPGLEPGKPVVVTFTEPRKTEGPGTTVTPERHESPTPEAGSIEANAETNKVTVDNVPPGTTVIIRDMSGNEIGRAVNNGSGNGEVTVTINPPHQMQVGDAVEVTFTEPGGKESQPMIVSVIGPSEPADPKKISMNEDEEGITIVTVRDVPPFAEVIVYDDETGTVLGRERNDDERVNDVTVGLNEKPTNGNVKIVIVEHEQLPSAPVLYPPLPPHDAPAEEDIAANATDDTVTVQKVPPGATVTVYDKEGKEIGTATNNGDTEGPVVVNINPPGLAPGEKVTVTITVPGRGESLETEVEAEKSPSSAPKDVLTEADAEDQSVTVKEVPPGATVTVKDEIGNIIGTETNEDPFPREVKVWIDYPYEITQGEVLEITITERDGNESDPLETTVQVERSEPLSPDGIRTIIATDKVIVPAVEPGATVYVYDEGGNLIGYATNNGDEPASLEIQIKEPGIQAGDKIDLTIRKKDELESSKTRVTVALEVTSAPLPEHLTANVTTNKITVEEVPAEATVRVYGPNGLIASRKNPSSSAGTIELHLTLPIRSGQDYTVTIQEPGKLVSGSTPVTAKEQSFIPTLDDIVSVDAENKKTVIGNVPPGTTVTIYDEEGRKLGEKTNNGTEPADLEIEWEQDEDAPPVKEITVTYTSPNKLPSPPLNVNVELATQRALEEALRNLSIGFSEGDTWESVTLPVLVASAADNGIPVNWSSSKTNVIALQQPENNQVTAIINRQPDNESVILTATVSQNGLTLQRTFLLLVRAAGLEKEVTDNHRNVEVTGGEQTELLPIQRIEMSNGIKIDKAILTMDVLSQLTAGGHNRGEKISLYVDEVASDVADELAFEVTRSALARLAANENSIEIRSDYGTLVLDTAQLQQMSHNGFDLYFRLIPIKDEARQTGVKRAVASEPVVREAAGANRTAEVLGSSLEIETNYSAFETSLFIPFAKNGITVPATGRDAFLDSLRVFIQHSDGTKVVETGSIVYNDGGVPVGISISIDKFSTFTVIQLKDRPVMVDPAPWGGPTPAPAPPVSVEKATLGSDGRTLEVDLGGTNPKADKSGFTVTVDGVPVEIESISIEGNKVIITLKNAAAAGQLVEISYRDGANGPIRSLHSFAVPGASAQGHHKAYIKGFPDGTFRPERPITRAELAAILARNLNLPESYVYRGLYPDVKASHWGAAYIEQLQQSGLLVGDYQGTFRPDAPVTRAEMATIAARWKKLVLAAPAGGQFPDVAAQHWATAAIEAVSREGIMIGFPDGTFGTTRALTRAEAVTVMNQLLERGPLTGLTSKLWTDVAESHWAYGNIAEASLDHNYVKLADGREQYGK